MSESGDMAERFETYRGRLREVAYLLLGSLDKTDEVVEDARARLTRTGLSHSTDLVDWLTAVVSRHCLELLRSRRSKREDPLAVRVPDLIVDPLGGADPEHEALLAKPVGVAMLVALDTLAPVERLTYVLHEMFDVGFDVIASISERTTMAVEQAMRRARDQIEELAVPEPETDPVAQRKAVDTFLTASGDSDLAGLEQLFAPDVLRRIDHGDVVPGGGATLLRGAKQVAVNSLAFSQLVHSSLVVDVNGIAGAATVLQGELASVLAFTVNQGKIVEIDILADRSRLSRVDVDSLSG